MRTYLLGILLPFVDNSIRIENLKASTTYTFKVRAKNEVGLGNPYEVSAITDAFSKMTLLVTWYSIVMNSSNFAGPFLLLLV